MATPAFTIQKDECYKYTVTKNTAGSWSLEVFTFDGYESGDDPLVSVNPVQSTSKQIELPQEDNVYVVRIRSDEVGVEPDPQEDTPVAVALYYYMVIYEYCSMEACFQSVLKDILCNETVCDPAEECEGNDIMSAEGTKRIDMIKILALYFEMMMLIHAEQMAYLNKFTLSDDRESRWQRASDNIKRITEVITHCGLCGSGAVGQSECQSC